jgi:cytochrome c-type biogenesis protein CcsB
MIPVFNLSIGLYLGALVAAILALLVHRRWAMALGPVLLGAGVACQTVYIVLRWIEAGRPPFSNMFESLVLLAWATVFFYLLLRLRTVRMPALDVAAAVAALLSLAYASTFAKEIKPLMPALRSNWLTVHVFTCFLGYAGFFVSCLASIGYLIVARPSALEKPEVRMGLETITAKAIAFGFLFLTLGIITGAVWANSAWGTYWSWDPKETWSLITWFVYATFLHCRFMRGWQGRRAAWISIVGFASVLFTYIGVNFLMSGLHSYAKP